MWTYGQGGTGPTLDELIHEPVIRLLMERDKRNRGGAASYYYDRPPASRQEISSVAPGYRGRRILSSIGTGSYSSECRSR